MKKILIVFLLIIVALPASAQEKKVKTGWKFGGALPTITYDSDLGFQYGALAEFFNYGDGSKYPDFLDHTYTEISRYTKGSGIYRFMYESNHLIPGVHMTSDLSYLPDQASHFYGFNGYESTFPGSTGCISSGVYSDWRSCWLDDPGAASGYQAESCDGSQRHG